MTLNEAREYNKNKSYTIIAKYSSAKNDYDYDYDIISKKNLEIYADEIEGSDWEVVE